MTDLATRFRDQGYATVPLFDPGMIVAAQADIAEHIDRVSRALYLPFEESWPDAPLGTRLDRIWQDDRGRANLLRLAVCTDAHRGPRLQAIANAANLRSMAEHLAGRAIAGTVLRIRASIGVFPEHKHKWHSDVAIDDGSSCGRVCITAWIPLCDAGPDQGGLEVAVGRRGAPLEHIRDRGYSIDEAQLVGLPRVQPSCPAGSVLFLDRFTPHRSLPAGQEARFALVIWMKAAS